jgi:hypothetical protein
MWKVSSDPSRSAYYEESFLRSTWSRKIARKNLPIHLFWDGSEEKFRLITSYTALVIVKSRKKPYRACVLTRMEPNKVVFMP